MFFITKTIKEPCPICSWIMLADYHKDNSFSFNGRNKMDTNINIQRKMKVYIAASYTRIKEAKALGETLEQKEFSVVSNWHQDHDNPIDADYLSGPRAIRDQYAIESCDLFVEFIGDEGSKGGRHCELGMALAWNKKIILIGDLDCCIFTNLPWLPRMKNVEEFLAKIC